MKKNKLIKTIFILITLIITLSIQKTLAAPSNIIVRFNDTEYYIVEAEEKEIPKGFTTGKLTNFGIAVKAYKNGPLTIVKISDEKYNYRFIAMDENNEHKPYSLDIQKIENEVYYIIPYQIAEYKNSEYELTPYNTKIKDQIITCYSTNKYGYKNKIVYGINNNGELKLLYYENNEYKLLDNKTNEEVTSNNTKTEIEEPTSNSIKKTESKPDNLENVLFIVIIIGITSMIILIIKQNRKYKF